MAERTREQILSEMLTLKALRDTGHAKEADERFYPWLEELTGKQSQELFEDLVNLFGVQK